MKLSEAPTWPPIQPGTRVSTPLGEGRFAYGRQNSSIWTSASVVLEAKRNMIGYTGTTFFAKDIELLEELPEW